MNDNLLKEYVRSAIQEIHILDTVDALWLAAWLIQMGIYFLSQFGYSIKRSRNKDFFRASEPDSREKTERALLKLKREGFEFNKTKDRYTDKAIEVLAIEAHFPDTKQQFTLYVIHLKYLYVITGGGKEDDYAFAVTSDNDMNINDAVKKLKDIY